MPDNEKTRVFCLLMPNIVIIKKTGVFSIKVEISFYTDLIQPNHVVYIRSFLSRDDVLASRRVVR